MNHSGIVLNRVITSPLLCAVNLNQRWHCLYFYSFLRHHSCSKTDSSHPFGLVLHSSHIHAFKELRVVIRHFQISRLDWRTGGWWACLLFMSPSLKYKSHDTAVIAAFLPSLLPSLAEIQQWSRRLYCDFVLCDWDRECEEESVARNKNWFSALHQGCSLYVWVPACDY